MKYLLSNIEHSPKQEIFGLFDNFRKVCRFITIYCYECKTKVKNNFCLTTIHENDVHRSNYYDNAEYVLNFTHSNGKKLNTIEVVFKDTYNFSTLDEIDQIIPEFVSQTDLISSPSEIFNFKNIDVKSWKFEELEDSTDEETEYPIIEYQEPTEEQLREQAEFEYEYDKYDNISNYY